MNESELKKLWQSYDQKIDKIIAINKVQLTALQKEKANSKVDSFVRTHFIVMLLGIVWIAFLSFLVYHTYLVNIYFAVSAGFIISFNVFAVLLYLRHIIILKEIDITESITETQRKIASVSTSYTQSGRILLLQSPFFCTFWYTDELVHQAGFGFWLTQLAVVSLFTAASIYLYKMLSIHNPSPKWRRITAKYFGAAKLQKALESLREIDEFVKEDELDTE